MSASPVVSQEFPNELRVKLLTFMEAMNVTEPMKQVVLNSSFILNPLFNMMSLRDLLTDAQTLLALSNLSVDDTTLGSPYPEGNCRKIHRSTSSISYVFASRMFVPRPPFVDLGIRFISSESNSSSATSMVSSVSSFLTSNNITSLTTITAIADTITSLSPVPSSSLSTSSFILLKFSNKYMVWIWFQWIRIAFEYWRGNIDLAGLPVWIKEKDMCLASSGTDVSVVIGDKVTSGRCVLDLKQPFVLTCVVKGDVSLPPKVVDLRSVTEINSTINSTPAKSHLLSISHVKVFKPSSSSKNGKLVVETFSSSSSSSTSGHGGSKPSKAESFLIRVGNECHHYDDRIEHEGRELQWDELTVFDVNSSETKVGTSLGIEIFHSTTQSGQDPVLYHQYNPLSSLIRGKVSTFKANLNLKPGIC